MRPHLALHGYPSTQGATNDKLHDANGVCVAPTVVQLVRHLASAIFGIAVHTLLI